MLTSFMKRRDLLARLALAGVDMEAQPTYPAESLYIPKAHLVDDLTASFYQRFQK